MCFGLHSNLINLILFKTNMLKMPIGSFWGKFKWILKYELWKENKNIQPFFATFKSEMI